MGTIILGQKAVLLWTPVTRKVVKLGRGWNRKTTETKGYSAGE